MARFVSLADERKLHLARLAREHLPPGQRRKLRDPQAAEVGSFEKQPIAFRSSGTEEELHVDIAEERCANWRGAFLILMSGEALNRVNPTVCANPRSDFTAAM